MVSYRIDERREALVNTILVADALVIDTECATKFASGLLAPCFFNSSVFQGDFGNRRLVLNALQSTYRKVRAELQVLGRDPVRLLPAAVAVGGISWAAWLSPNRRMATMRKSNDNEGVRWRVTGFSRPEEIRGERFVVIEDVFTKGTSSIAAARALREAGGLVEHIIAIAHYDFPQGPLLEESGLKLRCLVSIPELVTIGRERGRFSDAERQEFVRWYQDPVGWTASWRGSGRPVRQR